MRLQKASRCALFAMLELAAQPGRQMSAGEIAAKYQVSTNHLAKVLRTLGRAGLLEAERGAGGGYRFTGNRRRVTLLDIVALFETIDPIRAGAREDGDETPEGQALCQVLTEIEEIGRATFTSISLETMLKLAGRYKDA